MLVVFAQQAKVIMAERVAKGVRLAVAAVLAALVARAQRRMWVALAVLDARAILLASCFIMLVAAVAVQKELILTVLELAAPVVVETVAVIPPQLLALQILVVAAAAAPLMWQVEPVEVVSL